MQQESGGIARESDSRTKTAMYLRDCLANRCVLADQDVVDVLAEGRRVVVYVHELDGHQGGAAERRVAAVPGLYGEVVVLAHLKVEVIRYQNRP